MSEHVHEEENIPGDPPAKKSLTEVQPHPDFVPIPVPEPEPATDEDD